MKFAYSKIRWSNLFDDSFTAEKWLCIKIGVVYMLVPMFHVLSRYYPDSVGLWSLMDTSILQNPYVKAGVVACIILLLTLYLLEKEMIWTSLLLFFISVFVFSIRESNGIMSRGGLVSLVLLAQCMAYIFHRFNSDRNLNYDRIQFSIQFIAAMYTLAAISKWHDSGLNWVIDAPKMALQIQKSYDYAFVSNGDLSYREKGVFIAEWVIRHPLITQIAMAATLVIETFAGLMLISRKWAFYYGMLLLCMHIGIMIMMNISSFMVPLVIFCFNPLFLLYALANNFIFRSKQLFRKE